MTIQQEIKFVRKDFDEIKKDIEEIFSPYFKDMIETFLTQLEENIHYKRNIKDIENNNFKTIWDQIKERLENKNITWTTEDKNTIFQYPFESSSLLCRHNFFSIFRMVYLSIKAKENIRIEQQTGGGY